MFDLWQWDLANESEAWGKVRQKWTEMDDQMTRWMYGFTVYTETRKTNST